MIKSSFVNLLFFVLFACCVLQRQKPEKKQEGFVRTGFSQALATCLMCFQNRRLFFSLGASLGPLLKLLQDLIIGIRF